jgi:hypothetical protein
MNRDPTNNDWFVVGPSSSYRQNKRFYGITTERTIVTAIYTRIAIDVAALTFEHVRTDDNGKFTETIDSKLNYVLTEEANIDQTSRAFIQDIVESMCDEGEIAVVPVDTTINPTKTGSYDIETMRVGKIVQWYPQHIKVSLYNDKTGKKEEIILPKKVVSIIINPLYSVMNEQNSMGKRLIHKLNLLDTVDNTNSSNKLNMILSFPWLTNSDAKKKQAEKRRQEIEDQLMRSPFGIAYTDGTEKITQLNRSLENGLLAQVQYLTTMLYNQLGMTESVMNGTASEAEMLNYYSRTIEPIASAIADEFSRKFLTKTARKQKQKITFFKDPFQLTPTSQIAEMADKFTRNEILSTNEFRSIIGYKPVDSERANELSNKNLNKPEGEELPPAVVGDETDTDYSNQKLKDL